MVACFYFLLHGVDCVSSKWHNEKGLRAENKKKEKKKRPEGWHVCKGRSVR